jgi:phage head maturation protease
MKKNLKLYGDIAKTEEQSDGTVKVWGYASSSAVDSDGETITPDAMKAALPEYMKFANVREMHTSKAAGIAIEAEVQEDGRTFFGAHVIDPVAVMKVKAGVYKGFSIGGKVTSRDKVNKSIIDGLRLAEVSLVDRPANPEALFTFFKMDGLEGEGLEGDEDEALVPVVKGASDKPETNGSAGFIAPPAPAPAPAAAGEVTIRVSKAQAEFIAGLDADSLAAMQKFIAAEAKKGMGHVATFALLLKAILSLVQDQQAEALREGDSSTMPAKLSDWLAAGGELLKDMAVEEVGELTTSSDEADTDYNTPMLYLAARAVGLLKGDLGKAGAALSAASKKQIQAIHDASAALGACSTTTTGKHEHGDDLVKLQGAASALDAIGKALGLEDGTLIAPAVEKMAKRVKELEALPAPTNATLKVVSKGEDVIDETAGKAEKEDTPKTDVDVMKGIHTRPLVMTANGTRPLY